MSNLKRVAVQVFDANAGTKTPVLDGPWWLAGALVLAIVTFNVAPDPWRWIAVPVLVIFGLLPFVAHWVVALARAIPEFRKGYRN